MEEHIGNVTVTAKLHDTSPERIESFSDVTARYDQLSERQKEHFYAVFLNGSNEVLAEKLIGLGTASDVKIDVTDIARTAVLINARAVILVHNHPSGDASPSQKDVRTTEEIGDALELLDISMFDHVIIGRRENHSMRKHVDIRFT